MAEHPPELQCLLTQLRAVLNEANRLTIERLRYQGNFEVDFGAALDSTERSREALISYVSGPLKQAFADLGHYLVDQEMMIELSSPPDFPPPFDSDPEIKYAATAQGWYEAIYPPMKVG